MDAVVLEPEHVCADLCSLMLWSYSWTVLVQAMHLFDFRLLYRRLELLKFVSKYVGRTGKSGDLYFEHNDVYDGHDC